MVPIMADAFVLTSTLYQSFWDYLKNGWQHLNTRLPEPLKWDGPEDSQYHRVSFSAVVPGGEIGIKVAFAEGVRWEQSVQVMGRSYRDFEPPEIRVIKGATTSVLDPFDIVMRPLRRT
jgi:hypothetical protein